jgi:hypothetical protein
VRAVTAVAATPVRRPPRQGFVPGIIVALCAAILGVLVVAGDDGPSGTGDVRTVGREDLPDAWAPDPDAGGPSAAGPRLGNDGPGGPPLVAPGGSSGPAAPLPGGRRPPGQGSSAGRAAGDVGGGVQVGSNSGGGGTATGATRSAPLACAAGRNGGATDVGVTADRVVLGATVVESGVARAFLGEMRIGMEAVVDKVNREGGVCGRLLEVRYRDDEWSADRGARYLQNLVEDEGVFALAVVPSTEGLNQASLQGYFARKRVPVVGTDRKSVV